MKRFVVCRLTFTLNELTSLTSIAMKDWWSKVDAARYDAKSRTFFVDSDVVDPIQLASGVVNEAIAAARRESGSRSSGFYEHLRNQLVKSAARLTFLSLGVRFQEVEKLAPAKAFSLSEGFQNKGLIFVCCMLAFYNCQ